jgi:hypothetical protein
MAENPWTDLHAEAANIKTPKAVFSYQADLLTQSTDRKIVGQVRTTRRQGGSVLIELNAVAPTLNGYSVTLASATHTALLYPCYLRSDWLDGTPPIPAAADASALEQQLADLLRMPELRKVVTSIYAQVLG